jgi:uncharacterized damage-inducible protein DinB
MNRLLSDLFAHQSWADAEHWRAFEAAPHVFEDAALFNRLYHIHLVQHAFLAVCRKDRSFKPSDIKEFANAAALKKYAISFHADALPFVDSLSEAQLEMPAVIPWFKDPTLHLTTGRALIQCVMHSQYHRGQNATRLRELGGEPPLTDLIAWYWKGQPDSRWI